MPNVGDEIKEKLGLSAPHTVHCMPGDIVTISMLGDADGNAPGGFAVLDARDFSVVERWEHGADAPPFMYDFWYQPRQNTLVSSAWGAPNTFKDGFNPADVAAGKYGRRLHFWDLERRAKVQTLDLGDDGLIPLELRWQFGLALSDDTAHEVEHALCLASALLIWAPLIGADPLPHRPGPRTSAACMGAGMVPMAAVALWLLTASSAVYGHYLGTLGPAALHDQRVAGAIMLVAGLPAFAVVPVARLRARGALRARALAGGQVAA